MILLEILYVPYLFWNKKVANCQGKEENHEKYHSAEISPHKYRTRIVKHSVFTERSVLTLRDRDNIRISAAVLNQNSESGFHRLSYFSMVCVKITAPTIIPSATLTKVLMNPLMKQ